MREAFHIPRCGNYLFLIVFLLPLLPISLKKLLSDGTGGRTTTYIPSVQDTEVIDLIKQDSVKESIDPKSSLLLSVEKWIDNGAFNRAPADNGNIIVSEDALKK